MKTYPRYLLPKCGAALSAFIAAGCLLFGQSSEDQVVRMDPWTVTEKSTNSYGATNSLGGSRINIPLLDVPMSLVAVNREFMDDVGALSSYDALRFVSGMGPSSSLTINSMTLRGIETRDDSFAILDGLPSGGREQETEFVERYEIVKGPAGTLYGDHSIGGLINRIYKKPLRIRKTTVKTSLSDIGSTWQASADTTGPIDQGGQLTYRIVGVYRDGETKTGGGDDKHGIYATLQYTPKGGRTQMWVRGESKYIKTGHETVGAFIDGAGQSSIAYFGNEIRTMPMVNNEERSDRYYEFGISTGTSGLLGDWDFRFVGRYNDNRLLGRLPAINPTGFIFLDKNGNSLGVTSTTVAAGQPKFTDPWVDIKLYNANTRVSGPNHDEKIGWYFDATGSFDTGPFAHRMLVYAQSTEIRNRAFFTQLSLKSEYGGTANGGNLNLAKAFSLVHPVYLPTTFDLFDLVPNSPNNTSTFSSGNRYNFGLQDNIYFWDNRLLFVGGLRYDYIRNNGSTNYRTNTSSRPTTTTNVVNKAALVLKPFKDRGVSFFVSRSETFDPRFGELIVGSGIPFKNLEGVAKEAGVKLELMGAKLTATGSYFDNRLNNNVIAIFDPNTGQYINKQLGVTTIKGWEYDMTWMVNDQWTGLIGLSDVNAINPTGLLLRGTQNSFNYKALVRYTPFRMGTLKGLSLGAAVVKVADRAGDSSSTFILPPFTTYDAFIAYTRGKWRVQLNARNITDTVANASSIHAAFIIPNDPRNFLLTLQRDF